MRMLVLCLLLTACTYVDGPPCKRVERSSTVTIESNCREANDADINRPRD